ncbi:MAG: hypothetical protein LPK18_03190 [Pseudomonadaceae bacterium]|nr:hypothetical protein [Pseudomonadaceae bacterium]
MAFSFLFRVLFRGRLVALLSSAVSFVLFASFLAFMFGGRQPVTTALDVGISAIRLVVPFLIVFWVQDLVHKEFERRLYSLSMTYPCSRARWLVARFLTLLLVVMVAVLLCSLVLAVQIGFFAEFSTQGTAVALGGAYGVAVALIFVDSLVLLCVALFLSVVAKTPSFVLLGTLGFMLIARTYVAVISLLAGNVGLVVGEETYASGLGLLGYLLPDLGGLDVRAISLYGNMAFLPEGWWLTVLSALVYAAMFLSISIWALQRKRLV